MLSVTPAVSVLERSAWCRRMRRPIGGRRRVPSAEVERSLPVVVPVDAAWQEERQAIERATSALDGTVIGAPESEPVGIRTNPLPKATADTLLKCSGGGEPEADQIGRKITRVARNGGAVTPTC